MKITAVRVTPIAISDPPLLNASGVHEPFALRSIIEVEADNGLVGLGETYGDKPVLDGLLRVKDALVGLSPFDLNGLWQRVAAAGAPAAKGIELDVAPGSATNKGERKVFGGFEVAFVDLQARSLGIPVHALLGGAVRRQVPFSAYLFFKFASDVDPSYKPDPWGPALEADQLVAQARQMIDQYGFGSIKLKAGALAPEHEVECLKALKRAFPNHPLRIDPNANWSLDTAIRMAEHLQGDLEYYPAPGHRPAAGHQHGRDRHGGVPPQRVAERRADRAVRPPLLGRPACHAATGDDVRDLRARAVDAFQLAPGHQPDGDVASGRRRAQSDLRL
jgi:glucarate dehydratase